MKKAHHDLPGSHEKSEQKYQSRVMSGEWNDLTQEQEEIVALKARLASLNSPCRQTDTTTKKKKISKTLTIERIKRHLTSRGNMHELEKIQEKLRFKLN
jgi:septum formation inhibitor-activating ATPase MinD